MSELSPLVTICLPFSRKLHPDWAISLASIAPPMNATFNIRRTINMERGPARDYLAEQAVSDGSEFVLFLDDDVTFPSNIIRKLLFQFGNSEDDVMVIGGIYTTKTDPPMPLVFKDIGRGPFYKWKLGDVFECDIIATGMMMIRTEVFKNLPKPWFKDIDSVEEGIKYNLIPPDFDTNRFAINDDGFFCRKVKDAGYKVMAHGGILGMHWEGDSAYLLPDNSYPIMSEMVKRWGKEQPTEAEYKRRYMTIVKDWYGNVDLLPIEHDATLNVV